MASPQPDTSEMSSITDEVLINMDLQKVPGVLNRDEFFLTELLGTQNGLRDLGSRFLLHHGFIQKVSDISRADGDLSYRTSAEIVQALTDGKGDILFVEGRPVAITLIPRLFPVEVQTMMLSRLGYHSAQILDRESDLYFQRPIREIALGLTPEESDRGNGYYKKTKLRLIGKIAYEEQQTMGSSKAAYTSSTSANAASAIVSARGAMAPVRPETTLLGATVAAFAPDEYSPKDIPDYAEIRWMSGNPMQNLLLKLAGVFINRENRSDLDKYKYFGWNEPLEPPVVFTSMPKTFATIDFLDDADTDDTIKADQYFQKALKTQDKNTLTELHEHLLRVITGSPKFTENRANLEKIADELNLPSNIDPESRLAYVLLLNTLSEINAERNSKRKHYV